jgi:hypothetical protein
MGSTLARRWGTPRHASNATHLGYVASATDARIEEWAFYDSSKRTNPSLDKQRAFIEGGSIFDERFHSIVGMHNTSPPISAQPGALVEAWIQATFRLSPTGA